MRLRPLVCALVCAAAEATASAPPLGSLLASAPPPAIAEALERLSAAPADSERLRALLNASPAVGGVSGLLEHTARAMEAAPRSAGAQLAHALILREAGRCAEAAPIFTAVGTATGLRLRARCELDSGELEAAFKSLEAGAALAKPAERAEILDALLEVALSAERAEVVDRAVAGLLEGTPRDVERTVALAERLEGRGRVDAALKLWEQLAAGQDPRVTVLATLRVGRIAVRSGNPGRGIAVLEGALGRLPDEHPAEPELREALIDAYRQAGREPEYISKLEGRRRSYPETLVLARLYEESGQDAKALVLWREAWSLRPRNRDARDAVMRIVSRIGTPEDVEAELRRLVKSGGPDAELELAAHLHASGKGPAATKLLGQLAARASGDAEVLIAVGELLQRIDGPADLVEKVYEALIRLEPGEEAHLVAYGEVWFARGDTARAITVWERIPSAMKSAPRAALVLARLYADHDLMVEADKHYRRAVELTPTKASTARSYALFLERARRGAEAVPLWEKVHELIPPAEAEARRDARRRIIELLEADGALDARLDAWAKSGPTASRLFVAEAHLARRRLDAAGAALAGAEDVESLLLLDEIHERSNRAEESLRVLERLVQLDPSHAAPRLRRMSELSLGLGRSEDAERFAERRVDLAPGDAQALEWLGDVQLARGRPEMALASWRRSLEADPAPVPLRQKLVRLLDTLGRTREIEVALTEIVERASDPTDVLSAGRQLAAVAGPTGISRLQALLSRLKAQHPRKPVYRELLLDLFASRATALDRARRAAPESDARARLALLGEQALQAVVESMSGPSASVRHRVLRLIALTRPSPVAPLLGRLLSEKDRSVAAQAIVALTHVAMGHGPRPTGLSASLPALTGLATARDHGLANLAIWALGAEAGAPASSTLTRFVIGPEARPDRGFVTALALGIRGRADGLDAALELLRSGDVTVRPAAAWALGAIGERRAVRALVDRLTGETGAARAAIAWALGAIGEASALGPVLEAGWADPGDHPALADAALALLSPAPEPGSRRLRLIDAYLDVADPAESRLAAERAFPALLVPLQSGPAAPNALGRHQEAVREALQRALAASGPVAQRTVLMGLLGGAAVSAQAAPTPTERASLRLGPLLPDLEVPDAWLPAVDTAVARLALGGEPRVRLLALRVLGRTRGEAGSRALEEALARREPEAATAAAESIAERGTPQAAAQLSSLLPSLDSWLHRARVARALGRLGAEAALMTLVRDPSSGVRVAALESLAVRGEGAVAVVSAALGDPDPLTVAAGLRLALRSGVDVRAQLPGLLKHKSPSVRRAALIAGRGAGSAR